MKQNKYLWLCLVVVCFELGWSITATVVCVKQDRKVQDLEAQLSYYKDQYHSCLQGKMRLRDQLNN